MIHSQFMKIYWTKGWLHPQNTFFTVKNLMLRITSAVQTFSDGELLTKYLYKPNFARYYSQNIHSSKHMVPSKVMFLLPRNAGLITIEVGSTECLGWKQSSVSTQSPQFGDTKKWERTQRLILGMELNLPRLYQGYSSWGWWYCHPPGDHSQPYLLWEKQEISGCSST